MPADQICTKHNRLKDWRTSPYDAGKEGYFCPECVEQIYEQQRQGMQVLSSLIKGSNNAR